MKFLVQKRYSYDPYFGCYVVLVVLLFPLRGVLTGAHNSSEVRDRKLRCDRPVKRLIHCSLSVYASGLEHCLIHFRHARTRAKINTIMVTKRCCTCLISKNHDLMVLMVLMVWLYIFKGDIL